MTQPPVAGVHDEVANGPSLGVNEHPVDVTDLAVGRADVISNHCARAAQMGIVATLPVSLCLRLGECGLPLSLCCAGRFGTVVIREHHLRSHAVTPDPKPTPVIREAVVRVVLDFMLS
ncbi:MAG: hypothetical protein ABI363_06305, partial [Nitrosospira sp.]